MTLALAHINMGDVPTAIAAAAAAVAAVFAYFAYRTQRRALTDQRKANANQQKLLSEQLMDQRAAAAAQASNAAAQHALLKQQLADQQATNQAQREALEREREDRARSAEREALAQAESVSVVSVAGPNTSGQSQANYTALVHNDSPSPIRNVVVTGRLGSLSSQPSETASVIRGFNNQQFVVGFDTPTVVSRADLRWAVEFVDAKGVAWRVTSEGRLLSRARGEQSWTTRRPAPGDPAG